MERISTPELVRFSPATEAAFISMFRGIRRMGENTSLHFIFYNDLQEKQAVIDRLKKWSSSEEGLPLILATTDAEQGADPVMALQHTLLQAPAEGKFRTPQALVFCDMDAVIEYDKSHDCDTLNAFNMSVDTLHAFRGPVFYLFQRQNFDALKKSMADAYDRRTRDIEVERE